MIVQDGYTFPVAVHGKMQQGSPPEIGLQVTRFAGCPGESHIVSPAGGRDLFLTAVFRNSITAMNTFNVGLANVNTKVDEPLTGRVTVTIGADEESFDKCTFMGFTPDGPQWFEPHYGWMVRGVLRWRQRDPNTIPEE